ncbi:MAG TPA: DUF1003 domain-containing protein [Capsulimonadaceae bacterium]|jgi:uncharacterized membrane protein
MTTPNASDPDAPTAVAADFWQQFIPHKFERRHAPVKNANDVNRDSMSPLDKAAIAVTDRVGSVGFFLIIFAWTVLWTGYNIIATKLPGLHWHAFDPFPAFVAYLLISNVIQILLMPLIMVGQNLQGRHTEIRAELDFETNLKAEKEVEVILRHIEHNSELLIHLMRHMNCKLTDDEEAALKERATVISSLAAAQVAPTS